MGIFKKKTEDDGHVIPFVKPEQVHNFKIWRGRVTVGKGRNKTDIEQINISSLDGLWQVKIPATIEMFSLITDWFMNTTPEERREDGAMQTVLANMVYATCVSNGYFHQGLQLVASIYADPSVLDKKSEHYTGFMKDVKATVKGYREWRADYDKKVADNAEAEKEMDDDQRAEEMADVLDKTK